MLLNGIIFTEGRGIMSLEFELPMVSTIFILLLNIVYFSRKKVNLVENKAFSAILIFSFIESFLDTIVHYICAIKTFDVLQKKYYLFFDIVNKFLSTFFVIIFTALLSYVLIITYEKVRKNLKLILIPASSLIVLFSIIMLFTKIELVEKSNVTNVVGSTATM